MIVSKDIGNKCIYCKKDTSFGSGRFVNRISADDGEFDGYACAGCMEIECDRCGKMIGLDDDVRVNNLVLHWDCQTKEEYEIYCKENFIDIKEEPYDENDMGENSTTSHNLNEGE